MVSIIVPRLSWHPGLKGELTNCSDLFSSSLNQTDCINMSKVSLLDFMHSTDVFRCDLDMAVLTPGPMDSILMLWSISMWLHCSDMFLVSHFNLWGLADFCKFKFESLASTLMPNASIQMFCGIGGWPG